MFTKILKTTFFILLTVTFALSTVGQANADTPLLQYDLDTHFSNGTSVPPSGTAPWLTATFDNNDIIDGDVTSVLLTMDSSGLNGTEGVLDWYFNFDPNESASALNFAWVSGAQASSINQGNDNWKADGDGFFDFQFVFADEVFNPNMSSVYEVSYNSAITYSSFNFLSTSGGGQGSYYSAAQVNDIGGNDQGSGFVGVVPEPISSTLFIIGGATLGFRRFRKKFKK